MKLVARELAVPLSLPGGDAIDARASALAGFRIEAELGSALAVNAGAVRARENLLALTAGEVLVVATGQQPCFPMPLGLTLMKIATAIALAGRLAERLTRPVLPLFWCAADDSDFDEARGQFVERETGSPLRVSLPASREKKGAFVGDLRVDDALGELARLSCLPRRSDLQPAEAGEDLGARECRILASLFAASGLLVLDAREAGLRRAALPVFTKYAENREAFTSSIDERGGELVADLAERPLREGIGERALFFLRRRRRSLPEPGEYAERLAGRLGSQPDQLSPNASLRPIVQDAVLPVLAAVLGPSEWNYHAQIEAAFGVLGQSMAPRYPRLRIETGREAGPVPPGGRGSSPLLMGGPLADPEFLVDAARRHLDYWESGRHTLLLEEGEQ